MMRKKPLGYEIKNRGWKWTVYTIHGKTGYRRRLGVFTSEKQAKNWVEGIIWRGPLR